MSQVSYQHLVLLHGVCMAGDGERHSPPHPCPASLSQSRAAIAVHIQSLPWLGLRSTRVYHPPPQISKPVPISLNHHSLRKQLQAPTNTSPSKLSQVRQTWVPISLCCSFARSMLPLQASVPSVQLSSYLLGAQYVPGAGCLA